ncbi:unnamed protein product [Rotaria sp. Silwood2]|nr:unnamed protein product [Rotaria sp. Silwood2]CAF3985868.1 unnamed protein product [Rotaria sp. Silwood2]
MLSSPLCTIHQQGIGQLEHVQITSYSLNIRFKNIFSNLQCSSIYIHAFITDTHTNQLERTIQNIQTNTISINHLLPNHNYSLTIKISDETYVRILPTHIFQTLESSNQNTLTLSNDDLLTIEQIESFIFPDTHLYIVTLPNHIRRSTILGNITLSYKINGKFVFFYSFHIK